MRYVGVCKRPSPHLGHPYPLQALYIPRGYLPVPYPSGRWPFSSQSHVRCPFLGHSGTFRDFWHLFSNMASLFRCTASKVPSARFLRSLSLGKNLAAISAFLSSSSSHNAIKTVTVIGSGLMGAGIAQVKWMGNNHYSSSLDKFGEILFYFIIVYYNLQYSLKLSSRSLLQN